MNILAVIAVSLITGLTSFVGAYKYMPLSWLETVNDTFGSTITTINGSDTLSSSRAVINTNFANLNTDKVEVSDLGASTTMPQLTTLANLSTVGTITSGVWSGTTILTSKGGTGSTTLSSNQVLLGNGTGNIGVVSGWGTSGQLLQSNGGTSAPTWQSQGTIPVGSVSAYASTTAPTGWLLADGTSYATTTYASLFSVIGYSYGGTGANFNVPDIKGRNILMASTTANIGQTGGESNHTLTTAEMPAHTHTVTYGSLGSGATTNVSGGSSTLVVGTVNTGSAGSDGAHNVLDPYFVLQYIIKY